MFHHVHTAQCVYGLADFASYHALGVIAAVVIATVVGWTYANLNM